MPPASAPPIPLTAAQRAVASSHVDDAARILNHEFGGYARLRPDLFAEMRDGATLALVRAAQRHDTARLVPLRRRGRLVRRNGKPVFTTVAFGTYLYHAIVNAGLNAKERYNAAKRGLARELSRPLSDYVIDNLADRSVVIPDIDIDSLSLAAYVADLLRVLHPRYAEVVRLRYGINCTQLTTDEIAAHLGVTRVRVNQIMRESLDKLRCAAVRAQLGGGR